MVTAPVALPGSSQHCSSPPPTSMPSPAHQGFPHSTAPSSSSSMLSRNSQFHQRPKAQMSQPCPIILSLFHGPVEVPSLFPDGSHQELSLAGPGMYRAVLSHAGKEMALGGSWHRPISAQGTGPRGSHLLEVTKGRGSRGRAEMM